MNACPPATPARTSRLRRTVWAAVLTAALALGALAASVPAAGPSAPQEAARTGTVRVGTPIGTNRVVRGSSWALPAKGVVGRSGGARVAARGSSWS